MHANKTIGQQYKTILLQPLLKMIDIWSKCHNIEIFLNEFQFRIFSRVRKGKLLEWYIFCKNDVDVYYFII